MKNLPLILLSSSLISCQMNSDQQNKQQIIEAYIEAYNQFDIAGMVKDLHPDVVFQNITNNEVDLETKGIEAFQKQAEAATQYFSTRQQRIRSITFQDQRVVIDIAYEAILAIDLPNGMKVGDTLQLKGQSEFEFEGDKIIKLTDRS